MHFAGILLVAASLAVCLAVSASPATADIDTGLAVFDAGGRIVAEIPSSEFRAGSHLISWDGRGSSEQRVPAGTYFLRLQGAADGQPERLVVIR
jgi:flagellar hook assembly protein FlgD